MIAAPKICVTCLIGIDVEEVVYVRPGDAFKRKGVEKMSRNWPYPCIMALSFASRKEAKRFKGLFIVPVEILEKETS